MFYPTFYVQMKVHKWQNSCSQEVTFSLNRDAEIRLYSILQPRCSSNYPRCAGLSVGMIKGFRAPEKTSVTATDNDRDRPTAASVDKTHDGDASSGTDSGRKKESIALLLSRSGMGIAGSHRQSVTLPVVARARRGHSQAARGEARSAANGWSMTEGGTVDVCDMAEKESVQERLELDMDLNV